jgi:hypothetical protein
LLEDNDVREKIQFGALGALHYQLAEVIYRKKCKGELKAPKDTVPLFDFFEPRN